jgi:hypothetical protein
MKVIFSDIDGVLNSKHTPNPHKIPYVVDKRLLKRFRRVVERTKAKVVLTSSWRFDPIGLYAAKYWGIPYFDVIPDLPKISRRDEILKWLKSHPTVTRFVVIDDEDDELDDLPLFQPSALNGLTPEIAKGVVKYLDGKTNEDMRCNALVRTLQNIHGVFKDD